MSSFSHRAPTENPEYLIRQHDHPQRALIRGIGATALLLEDLDHRHREAAPLLDRTDDGEVLGVREDVAATVHAQATSARMRSFAASSRARARSCTFCEQIA